MPENARERLRFSRRQRLRTAREFSFLRAHGHRAARGSLLLNWAVTASRTHSRLGVVTSKAIGPAHVRSRARRLMREAFRLHQHRLRVPVDLVLVARRSIVGKDLAAVEGDYLALLQQAKLLKAPA